MDIFNQKKLIDLATAPTAPDGFLKWCEQADVPYFLDNEIKDEYILIYASLDHVFIHAVMVPQSVTIENNGDDLSKWSLNPYSSWSFMASSDKVWIEKPCQGAGCETLRDAKQIVFGRSFEGVDNRKNYYEINQEILHLLGLHFVSERKAWCKLDQHGDIENIIKIHDISSEESLAKGVAVTFKSSELQKYGAVSNLKMLRMFDFTRYRKDDFAGWGNSREERRLQPVENLSISLTVEPGVGSYSRGFQIMRPSCDVQKVHDELRGIATESKSKEYATYIAQDWKNKRIDEISCSPDALANYFTESDLPFELSPAFFRAEVLSKYKSDRQKYELLERSISCRGAWHLETFDINQAGQVHTYLIYLSKLPYDEQLHWKQFNERPKAPLSKRAIRTDFEGSWDEEYDPLPKLKTHLREISRNHIGWWVLRNEKAIDRVHYPFTTSRDEWAEEILNLDQLLIEGFEQKWLKNKLVELGCKPDSKYRALKLAECCLVESGFEEEHAHEIMSPFHDVHNLRSFVKGHTWGSRAEQASKDALREFSSYNLHFKSLCQRCEESLQNLIEAFTENASNNTQES